MLRALPLGALAVAACSFTADHGGTAYRCGEHGECPSGTSCYDGVCLSERPADGSPAPAGWWDDAWTTRRPLVVHNAADRTLPGGFQVGWTVDVASTFGDGGDAVRLVAYDPASEQWSELPYLIDGIADGPETVWFQLPAALEPGLDDTLWIYQDNPAAPPVSWTANAIFEMADSFSSLSPDRWVWQGAVTLGADAVRFDESGEMRSTAPWPVDRAVDIVARVDQAASRLWFGFQREVPDLMPDVPWLIWIRRTAGDSMLPEYAGPDDTLETRWAGTAVPVGTGEHVYSVERFADRVVYRLDYAIASADHDHRLAADHTAPLYIRFSNTSTSSFWTRRVRVRQTAYPPPDVALGAPETR